MHACIQSARFFASPLNQCLLFRCETFFGLYQQNEEHRVIGIKLLSAVATEMNFQGTRNAPKSRKAAVGFRDAQLLPLFQCGLNMIRSVLQNSNGIVLAKYAPIVFLEGSYHSSKLLK